MFLFTQRFWLVSLTLFCLAGWMFLSSTGCVSRPTYPTNGKKSDGVKTSDASTSTDQTSGGDSSGTPAPCGCKDSEICVEVTAGPKPADGGSGATPRCTALPAACQGNVTCDCLKKNATKDPNVPFSSCACAKLAEKKFSCGLP